MAQKTKTQETIDDKLSLSLEQGTKQVQELREARIDAQKVMTQSIERTKAAYAALELSELTEEKADKTKQEGAKELIIMEQTLEDIKQFNLTIGDLANGLQNKLSDHIAFATLMSEYQGWSEKWRAAIGKVGMTKYRQEANYLRQERVKTQNPRENLALIQQYSTSMVREICESRGDAWRMYNELKLAVDLVSTKVKDFYPEVTALKEKLDAMEAKYKDLNAKYDVADAETQAKMRDEITDLHDKLIPLRTEYDMKFTVYNNAQQTIQGNTTARDHFELMYRNLGIQAQTIQERMENMTSIYNAAPEATKIAIITVGMEATDQALIVGGEQCLDIIAKVSADVARTTLSRQEAQALNETFMRNVILKMRALSQEILDRTQKIEAQATRSPQERYGV